MDALARLAAAFVRMGQRAYTHIWAFLGLFLVVFVITLSILDALDLLPNPIPPSLDPAVTLTASPVNAGNSGPEEPVLIEIPSISLHVPIANPTTTDPVALDTQLLKGAVRYPTSAKLDQNGNVVVFGHSSYLPVVRNQAYKTFNGIQKLKAGETITVYSSHTAYVYTVKSVMKQNAETGAIPLSVGGRELTLATCDSFGEKTDRFVVVADFVESHSLANS